MREVTVPPRITAIGPAAGSECKQRAGTYGALKEKDVSFGPWLQHRRKRLDLTQDEFAQKIGCATSTLQKIEADRRRPSPEFAARLAEVLAIDSERRPAFVAFARGNVALEVSEIFRPPTNLPAPASPIFGREADVAAVRQRLLRDGTRLVTLTGPPGVGKTRLGLEVAGVVRDYFEHGVYLVPLAPVADPDLVVPTITTVLGLPERGQRAPLARLCDHLRFQEKLLLLDNFEQVVVAGPLLASLLAACPRLKLLVTSRMPLRLRAERQYPVPLLGLPRLASLPPPPALARYPAVALFLDRAEAVAPWFALTAENALAVATLCCRLDGLPLAIELVSARIKVLSPAQLLQRLGGPLRLQSDGLRDLEERQQTLENAIAWSYELLAPEEQRLFVQLGVFVGGWTLDAVESLQTSLGSSTTEATLDLLTSLVEKSLVRQLYVNGEMRFTMLETIRAYALGRLEARGEVDKVRAQHAATFLALIESASPRLHTSSTLIDTVEREHDNLRAALDWALAQGEIEIARRLVAALIWLWVIHTWHLSEGRMWLEQVVVAARERELPPLAQARLHQDAGILAYLQGDHVSARSWHRQALFFARQSSDRAMIAHALHGLSNAAMNQGAYDEVVTLLEECLPLARATGEKWLEAVALNNLAEVARLQRDFAVAGQMYETGLGILQEIGDRYFTPILLDGLGVLAQYRGDYERALAIHRRCLRLSQDMGDWRVIALALEKLGGVAAGQRRARRAARLLGAAEAIRKEIHVELEAIDRDDHERFLAMTRAQLDENSLAHAWGEGRAMNHRRAIAYGLEA